MSEKLSERPVLWVASSKRDLMDMPSEVKADFGFGLHQAQMGKLPDIGKVLAGFGGPNVIELVGDHKGGTFRAVYTVRFAGIVVVLHAFQKKSKKGIETPKQELGLIRSRLKMAEEIYKEWKIKRDTND